ncbi:Signal transduction histidine kinase [Actinacidiphila rubida]|uniref:Signal transduction histidine kinase n=2 Tax=Actinacidiphila rubida TaxID=310780 RepID=A0A1H8NKE6_9ACTN|nr:Signal transduction histidine kinase [Actinacidiphila rubida]
MLWAALGLIMVIRLLSAWQEGLAWPAILLATACYLPMVGLLQEWRRPGLAVRSLLLTVLAALYALPFALVGVRWDWLPWPLGVVALCVFRGRPGWALFGLVLVVTDLAGLRLGDGAVDACERTAKTAIDGIIVFSLYALAAMVAQLHATRGELARELLARERRRLDGELRALVGRRLRLLARQAARTLEAGAEDEADGRLEAMVGTARGALADVRRMAGAYRAPALPRPATAVPPDAPIVSPKEAKWALAGVYLCDALVTVFSDLAQFHRPWTVLVMAPIMCAAGAVLLLMRISRRQTALLGLLLVPTAFPLGDLLWELNLFTLLWPFFLGPLFTQYRRRDAWIVAGVLAVPYASLFVYPPPIPNPAGIAASVMSMVVLTWVSYSLIRLSQLVGLLREARRDLAREAVIRERTRVARDLHDLVSSSLSALALRGEACRKLLTSDPVLARARFVELSGLAERVQAELVALATGPAVLRTDDEVAAARSVLESVGVHVEVSVPVTPLPPEVDATLAAVLREAVTNVVRHSRAVTCTIAITSGAGLVCLRVVNDGAGPSGPGSAGLTRPAEPGPSGAGLLGMAERTVGRLSAGPVAQGRFEVVAEFVAGT